MEIFPNDFTSRLRFFYLHALIGNAIQLKQPVFLRIISMQMLHFMRQILFIRRHFEWIKNVEGGHEINCKNNGIYHWSHCSTPSIWGTLWLCQKWVPHLVRAFYSIYWITPSSVGHQQPRIFCLKNQRAAIFNTLRNNLSNLKKNFTKNCINQAWQKMEGNSSDKIRQK